MINNNNIMTMKEAACYIGMEYEAFRYHVKKMRGPEFLDKGKMRIFTKESLDAWQKTDDRKRPRK